MKRSLLSQMRNEWHENVAMVVGLAVLSIAIWYFCSSIFSTLRFYNLPMGFDEESVFVVKATRLGEESPEFTPPDGDLQESYDDDLRALLRRIRESPNVEAAGFSARGNPYDDGWGGDWMVVEGTDTLYYKAYYRMISPEIVSVLRMRSLNGESLETLQQRLEDGEIIFSTVYSRFEGNYSYGDDAVGKLTARCGDNSGRMYRVGGVIDCFRDSRYNQPWRGNALQKIYESSSIYYVDEIMLRVKPGMERKFLEEFYSSPDMREHRNVALFDPVPLSSIGEVRNHVKDLEVRLYCVVILFLLIVVFLGLFGTFWFRVERRTSEIAIRRVCGGSRSDIFRRILGEGLILFLCAAVVAGVLGWIVIIKLHLDNSYSLKEIFWLEAVSLAAVCIGIVLSILGPAYTAMKTEPAIAIKDE